MSQQNPDQAPRGEEQGMRRVDQAEEQVEGISEHPPARHYEETGGTPERENFPSQSGQS